MKLGFNASNNEAKNEALMNGLKMSLAIEIYGIKVLTDSQLVAQQLNGGYEARGKRMVRYVKVSQDLMARFESFEIVQFLREDNSHADAFTNLGSIFGVIIKRVIPCAFQDEQSIEAMKLTKVLSATPSEDWHKEIINYLERLVLPNNRVEARKIKWRATRYVMLSGELYPFLFFGPYQKCLSGDKCKESLKEVHKKECGNHVGGRSIVLKVMCLG